MIYKTVLPRYSAEFPKNAFREDVIEWCVETFGKDKWIAFNYTIQFFSEEDRNWFLLRWL